MSKIPATITKIVILNTEFVPVFSRLDENGKAVYLVYTYENGNLTGEPVEIFASEYEIFAQETLDYFRKKF